jgi:hypothetical protein
MTLPVVVECFAPREVEKADADAFKALVLEAGEVNPHTLPFLFNDAVALAFARSEGTLVGIGAIKRPNAEYRQRVFDQAGSKLRAASFPYELGWIYVSPAYQNNRICSRIVEGLTPHAQGAAVYATSRINNDAMHGSLIRPRRLPGQRLGLPVHRK